MERTLAPETTRKDAPLDVIADSLRRERARARLSLSGVAKQAGIAKSTLSQLESGTGNPSVETLWALSVALDVPLSRMVEPGRARESEPHQLGVVEHMVLAAGRALVGLVGDPVELRPGDYTGYPGDLAQVFEALEPGTRAVLLSESV